MAPLHHHFEQKGWSKSTVVIRFWIISILLAIISLITFKIDNMGLEINIIKKIF